MKTGANKSDVVQIKKLLEEGYSIEDISNKLLINQSCVESFAKSNKKSAKKTSKKEEKSEPEIVFSD